KIHPAIVVVIKNGDAAAHGLHDVVFLATSARKLKVNTGRSRHIHKVWRIGRRHARAGPSTTLVRRRCMLCGPGSRAREDDQRTNKKESPQASNQWARPVAIPPVSCCDRFSSAKRSISFRASSLLPDFAYALASK